MGNQTVIYTSIYNNYENLKAPKVVSPNCDYICLTDDPNLKSDFWNIICHAPENLDPTRKNRKTKILPHLYLPDYKYSVYMDGNIEMTGDFKYLVDTYLIDKDYKITGFNHPERDCIYQEARACIKLEKDTTENIQPQMKRYYQEGMPAHYGLFDNQILLRQHQDPQVIKLMEAWWEEVKHHSKRDQVSLFYIFWKHQFPAKPVEEGVRGNNNFFIETAHKHQNSN